MCGTVWLEVLYMLCGGQGPSGEDEEDEEEEEEEDEEEDEELDAMIKVSNVQVGNVA